MRVGLLVIVGLTLIVLQVNSGSLGSLKKREAKPDPGFMHEGTQSLGQSGRKKREAASPNIPGRKKREAEPEPGFMPTGLQSLGESGRKKREAMSIDDILNLIKRSAEPPMNIPLPF